MLPFNSFTDHVGSLSARAVETGAHRFILNPIGIRQWYRASVPTKSFISDPLPFTRGRGNPYSRYSFGMDDAKSPFSLKLDYVFVMNNLRSKWIDNFKSFFVEDEFGSYPNQICDNSQKEAKSNFEDDLNSIFNYYKTVNRKKKYQRYRSASPHKIAFRAKSFSHVPIIAGESK